MPKDLISDVELLDPQQIAADLRFTEATLSSEMMRQSALMGHYGMQLAKAQYEVDKLKQSLSLTEAKTAKMLRDRSAVSGSKMTEKMVDQAIERDKRVIEVKLRLNRAKANHEALRVALEGLKHKKDMMVQIGVGKRLELENQGQRIRAVETADERDRRNRQEARDRVKKLAPKD